MLVNNVVLTWVRPMVMGAVDDLDNDEPREVEALVAGDEEKLVAGAMDDEETEDKDMLVEDDEGMLGDAEISDNDDLLTVDDEGTMLRDKDPEASQVIHPISQMVRALAYYLIF